MMKPLPPVFAVCCVERDCWLVVARSGRPHDRTFDRQELRAVDSGALGSTGPDRQRHHAEHQRHEDQGFRG
jgi:hypothetical protein